MKRESGFYWVKFTNESGWVVAKYDSKTDAFFNPVYFSKGKEIIRVDEKIITA